MKYNKMCFYQDIRFRANNIWNVYVEGESIYLTIWFFVEIILQFEIPSNWWMGMLVQHNTYCNIILFVDFEYSRTAVYTIRTYQVLYNIL